MTKTLVLLRHAKAEVEAGLGDHPRPLAARGRRQSNAFGADLADAAGPFDVALVSSSLRTRETYRLLAHGAPEYPTPRILDELYLAAPRQIIRVLQALDESAQRVLVVGHEPALSNLAHILHDQWDATASALASGIPTAMAVVLDVPAPWADLDRQSAHVTAMLRPEH
ncbi:MAG TPA: histidine phosphatase family protein [Actinomycetaceae bacterium]|nr:histidine phosphatase family protein [Actinomycetaceae bacterium]